jgi:hypothetical protein
MASRASIALTALAAVVLAAGCGGTKTVTQTVTLPAVSAKTGVGPPGRLLEFGYIKSLQRQGAGYRMRFDPAWLLSGVTANVAAAEDGVVAPGEPVPNDHHVVDEGHRLLTYLVPPNARVRVLRSGSQLAGTPITVAQLARIVDGTSKLKLFEPITTGFWILIDIDTVRSIDQQYHP